MSKSGLWTMEHSVLFLEYIQVLFIISRQQTEHFYFSSISVKYSVDTSLGILTNFHFELFASGHSLENHRASCLPVLGYVLPASARLLLGQRLFVFCLAMQCSLLEDIYIWKTKLAILLVHAAAAPFKYFARAVSFRASILSCISSSYTHVTYI